MAWRSPFFWVLLIVVHIFFGTSTTESTIYETPTNLSPGSARSKRNAIVLLIPEFGNVLDGTKLLFAPTIADVINHDQGKPCSLPCSNVEKNVLIDFFDMVDHSLIDDFDTDIIIFHEGYPQTRDLKEMRKATKRNVDFVNVDAVFLRIPKNLDPYEEEPTWTKRGKWRYHQMIRFMVEDVFKFPVMNNVEYFLRIDMDSCFEKPLRNLFTFMKGPGRPAVYMANDKSMELASHLPGSHLLAPLVKSYVGKNRLVPAQGKAWNKTFSGASFYTYSNNFEIVSVEFFRRKDVSDFSQAILDSNGIFLYRWGDAGLRYITTTLFAHADEVLHRKHFDVDYRHPCTDRKTHEQNFEAFLKFSGSNNYDL